MATDSKCWGPWGGRGIWGGKFSSRARLLLWPPRGSCVRVSHLRSRGPLSPCPSSRVTGQDMGGQAVRGPLRRDAAPGWRGHLMQGVQRGWASQPFGECLQPGPELAFREPSIGAL
ncbi:hypothetical protein NN561_000229 [Cricetulus griseus]